MKTRRLANRNTVYRIGSITKPFTAVMLMQLIAAGRIQLSDPVERYLPEVTRTSATRSSAPRSPGRCSMRRSAASWQPTAFWTPGMDWVSWRTVATAMPTSGMAGASPDIMRPCTTTAD
ncbi:MAG: serine hydrolase domain-containing protein [bacterium]